MILDKMNSGYTDDQPRLNLESAGARNIGLATEPKPDTSTAEPALRRRRPPVLLAEVAGLLLGGLVGVVAITCLDMVYQLGALVVATDPTYTTALGLGGSVAVVLLPLLLDLQHFGYLIAQIFFGLWLFPLGLLAHRSGAFPRALGFVLMLPPPPTSSTSCCSSSPPPSPARSTR